MPKSFYIPAGYFEGIPSNMRVDPSRAYTKPEIVPACNAELVQPDKLNAYSFQSEQFLATLGLNIYDGSIHGLALAVLGEFESVTNNFVSLICLQGASL